jgi:glycosyltransferase involved in cell wall biosynthesis
MRKVADHETTLELSVVLPVYNEEDNVVRVCRELQDVLDRAGIDYELLFVDDGSIDSSVERLRGHRDGDPRIRIVRLRRNFGQTAAISAGFDLARGRIIATMDADGQNDPGDIPMMLDKLAEGYDMVCGWRFDRKDGYILRRLPSTLANRLISYTTEVKLHDYGCTLKVFHAEVAKNIALYGEMHRFIPAIASWLGVSIAEVKVNHRPRIAGASKYGISRVLRVVLDLMTVKFLLSFSSRPIQLFGTIGLASGIVGGGLMAWLAFQRLVLGQPLADRPLLLFAIVLAIVGVQFVLFGLLAEIQTRTYYESQDKPIYTIRDVIE